MVIGRSGGQVAGRSGGRPVGWSAGRVEVAEVKTNSAQLKLGLGLSLATNQIRKI